MLLIIRVMKSFRLNGPARMLFVLRLDRSHQRRRQQPGSASIHSDPRSQHRDRIVTGTARGVEPSFQGRQAEAHWPPADRMLPGALAQLPQCGLQMSLRRRRRQQGSDDGKAQSRPAIAIPFSASSQSSLLRHQASQHRQSAGRELSETITSYDHHPLWEVARRSESLAECAGKRRTFMSGVRP